MTAHRSRVVPPWMEPPPPRPPIGLMPPGSWKAWVRLTRAVLDAGHDVPCSGEARDYWTSDRKPERTIAARACGQCPVISQCDAFAVLADDRWHVLAGKDFGPSADDTSRNTPPPNEIGKETP